MRTFVNMRKYMNNNFSSINLINSKLLQHEERLCLVENTLNKKQKINSIFFKGQVFDAYIVMKEICEEAKKEVIIIDNYAGEELLKLLKDINKQITIISSNINKEDISKY